MVNWENLVLLQIFLCSIQQHFSLLLKQSLVPFICIIPALCPLRWRQMSRRCSANISHLFFVFRASLVFPCLLSSVTAVWIIIFLPSEKNQKKKTNQQLKDHIPLFALPPLSKAPWSMRSWITMRITMATTASGMARRRGRRRTTALSRGNVNTTRRRTVTDVAQENIYSLYLSRLEAFQAKAQSSCLFQFVILYQFTHTHKQSLLLQL